MSVTQLIPVHFSISSRPPGNYKSIKHLTHLPSSLWIFSSFSWLEQRANGRMHWKNFYSQQADHLNLAFKIQDASFAILHQVAQLPKGMMCVTVSPWTIGHLQVLTSFSLIKSLWAAQLLSNPASPKAIKKKMVSSKFLQVVLAFSKS